MHRQRFSSPDFRLFTITYNTSRRKKMSGEVMEVMASKTSRKRLCVPLNNVASNSALAQSIQNGQIRGQNLKIGLIKG